MSIESFVKMVGATNILVKIPWSSSSAIFVDLIITGRTVPVENISWLHPASVNRRYHLQMRVMNKANVSSCQSQSNIESGEESSTKILRLTEIVIKLLPLAVCVVTCPGRRYIHVTVARMISVH